MLQESHGVEASTTPRTQQQRRERTRAKLLDATIDILLDAGYAATTTRRVCELSGVSQGAQTHHFPRRVDLVGAAIEELAERRIAELTAAARELPADPRDRLPALLDLIWNDFSAPVFTVFVKLWVAAADDAELYARLVPVERRIAKVIAEESASVVGTLAGVADWESYLATVLATLRGLALSQNFEPRVGHVRDQWPAVRERLREMLLPGIDRA